MDIAMIANAQATEAQLPEVSVVMPVRDGAATIGEQLRALGKQRDAPHWELVISDNGSEDETLAIIERFRSRIGVELTIVDASQKRGVSYARNVGVQKARASRVLTCDADDVVDSYWVATMTAALECADLVGGALDHRQLNSDSALRHRHLGWVHTLEDPWNFLAFASGANVGFHRRVFDAIDGWDTEFAIAQDVDFSWRAQLAGFVLSFEPDAIVAYRHRTALLDRCRQTYRYSRAVPQLFRRHHSSGMPRPPTLRSLKTPAWLVLHIRDLVRDVEARQRWLVILSVWWGHLVGSVMNRVWYP